MIGRIFCIAIGLASATAVRTFVSAVMTRLLQIICCAFLLPLSFGLDGCDSCSEECSLIPQVGKTCHCDVNCGAYGDCCADKPPCSEESEIEIKNKAFQCQSTSLNVECSVDRKEAFWMVSLCPENWLTDETESTIEANIWVEANCNQGSTNLPPVSDLATGMVYRNEYCAVCNGVESIVPWSFTLQCSAKLHNDILFFNNVTLTQKVIEEECKPCSFAAPENFSLSSSGLSSPQPRPCQPHISTCSVQVDLSSPQWDQGQYDEAVEQCGTGPYSLVKINQSEMLPYRNQYCAVCNGISSQTLSCFIKDSENGNDDSPLSTSGSPFGIVLVFSGDGNVFVDSKIVKTTISVTCAAGEVFDPILNQCRLSICPQGYALNGGRCRMDLNETGCSGFIALNDSEYENFGNGSIGYNGEVKHIEYYDSKGRPLICLSQNGRINITVNFTEQSYTYPTGYIALSYTAYSLSILGSGLILLTYSIFKKLRTVPGKTLINLAAAILLTDLFLLFQKPILMQFSDKNLCAAVAIIVHMFFLAQFSWMSVMVFEMARTLRMGQKLAPGLSFYSKTKLFLTYLLIGWGCPLIVTTITAVVHFVTVHIVYGGIAGECFITHVIALIIASIVPVALSLLFNMIVFIYIAKMLCTGWHNRRNLNTSNRVPYFRVLLAIFTATGVTWIFGLIAILVNWAWYVFIVMSCTQGIVLAIGFLFSKKVGKLYLDMFRAWCHRRTLHLGGSQKKPKQVIDATNNADTQREVTQTTIAQISLPATTSESV